MRVLRWLLILCSLVYPIGTVSLGQILEGTISGRVLDPTGAVVPGVEVVLTHVERGTTRTTVTNEEGRYYATALPVGTYQITAELPGFKRYERTGVRLDAGAHVRVDVAMEVGEISETVTISGGPSLIRKAERAGLVYRPLRLPKTK